MLATAPFSSTPEETLWLLNERVPPPRLQVHNRGGLMTREYRVGWLSKTGRLNPNGAR